MYDAREQEVVLLDGARKVLDEIAWMREGEKGGDGEGERGKAGGGEGEKEGRREGEKEGMGEREREKGRLLLAFASRTEKRHWAIECLRLFKVGNGVSLYELCDFYQIFPADKKKHFRLLHEQSHVWYEDMIFFDNERRNVDSVAELGVFCKYSPNGLTYDLWIRSLKEFVKKREQSK